MTMETLDEQLSDEEQVEAPEPVYAINADVIEAAGRSISIVFGERLCDAAMAKLKSDDAWRTMNFKELRKLFRDNCSDQEGYLSPQQPLLETIVRMLLASKQDRVPLGDLHEEISALWITSPWPRHITVESLQRVLDRGVSYGIVRVDQA